MAFRFDATLKDIVAQHPDDFARAFGVSGTGPVSVINVDLSTITAASDVVLKVGDPPREIVDLNFQSGADARLPHRLLLYSALLSHRYDLPVRTIVVLLREKADAANLTGNFGFSTDGGSVEFRYQVVRLWEKPSETFLQGGVGATPLALLAQTTDEKTETLRSVLRVIDERLQKETEPAHAEYLMTAAFVLAALRADDNQLKEIFSGVTIMPKLPLWDEMELKGQVKQMHRVLLELGQEEFGTPDAAVQSALFDIRDLDRLERMMRAVRTSESWQELLAID